MTYTTNVPPPQHATLLRVWKRARLGLTALLSVLYLILTLTVHLRVWVAWDWDILRVTQAVVPRVVDVPFSLLTLVGSAEVTSVLFLGLVWRTPSTRRLSLLFAFAGATFLELIGKAIVYQPVTPHDLLRYVPLLPLFSSRVHPGFSYPSGHALRAVFLGIVCAEMLIMHDGQRATKITLGALLLIAEIAMLLSRVYLAEHWFTDVIGGALLGAASAFAALSIEGHTPKNARCAIM